jgi:SAM-dependent methyltransferase
MLKYFIRKLPVSFRDNNRLAWVNAKLKIAYVSGKFIRLFHMPAKPNNLDGSINLHLGCGSFDHPYFINIDAMPAPHIHYVRSIDNLSPFKSNSVDLIYASHCLEHFGHTKQAKVLGEWYRVLKPEGILRLSVPDFDLLLKIYIENDKDVNTILEPLLGGQDYLYNFHYCAFTNKSLEKLLLDVGFREVRCWEPGSSDLTTFHDWSMGLITVKNNKYPISLNIEAVK